LNSGKKLILADRPGQLGNLLFLYAHFIGFCLTHRVRLINPAFRIHENEFELSSGDKKLDGLISPQPSIMNSYGLSNLILKLCRKLKINNSLLSVQSLAEGESYSLDSDASLIRSRYNFISGWLYRGEENMATHKNAIRSMFSLSSSNQVQLSEYLEKHLSSSAMNVGVHIRQGDYETFEGGKYFFELKEYSDYMKRVKDFFVEKEVHFLVCSNADIDAGNFEGLDVTIGRGKAVIDMYALSACDLVIGPPSTFTMWGNFMTGVALIQLLKSEKASFEAKLAEIDFSS
jgi:hypothetical protein